MLKCKRLQKIYNNYITQKGVMSMLQLKKVKAVSVFMAAILALTACGGGTTKPTEDKGSKNGSGSTVAKVSSMKR